MNLCNREEWLRETAQVEEEGQVEAGLLVKEYSEAVAALTSKQNQQLRQQVKLQSILFTALQQWMETWDLGAGLDNTYTLARQLIRHHLANPTPAHLTTLDRLLAESVEPGSINSPTRKQAVALRKTGRQWQRPHRVLSRHGC